MKTEQRSVLHEEVNISKIGLGSVVDILRDFLRTFDKASKCLQNLLQKPKIEIVSTKSQDNHFAHYYIEIIEFPNWHIRLSFRFRKNSSCVFPITKFELHGNHFFHTEIVNHNYREIEHLCKNRYYVANECDLIVSNYDV